MSLHSRLERLERATPPNEQPCTCGPWRVGYLNDWRGERLHDQETMPTTCPRCGRALPVITIEYVDDWRAQEARNGR